MASKRPIALLLAAILFCALLFVYVVQSSGSQQPETVELTRLSLPESISAGSIVVIEADSAEPNGVALVSVSTGYGRLEFELFVDAGHGELILPAALTQHAGVITVESGSAVESLTVLPLQVAELVAPLVGPRTIVADGQDESVAVMLPVDRYGNQVADGTPIAVEWQQPAEAGSTRSTEVETDTVDGMAWVPVESGVVAGPTTVLATATAVDGETESQTVRGARVRIDEVPGRVVSVEVSASAERGVADGRSLIEFESTDLFDSNGNALLDGTVAQLVFAGPSGSGIVPGTVQNGIVRFEVVAPSQPGTLTASLHVHGVVSNQVEIDFATAIEDFELSVERIGSDVVLRVENARDGGGAFVADGTDVSWGEARTQLRHGAGEIWVPEAFLPDELPNVEILGLELHIPHQQENLS